MIEISNTNTVNVPLFDLSSLIQKNLFEKQKSLTIQIYIDIEPFIQNINSKHPTQSGYSISLEKLASLLPKGLINQGDSEYLVVTNLTFESTELSNPIDRLELRWGSDNIIYNSSKIIIPLTCWLLPNEATFSSKIFYFYFQQQFPKIINCTIKLTKLDSKWFYHFLYHGGICSIGKNYYISEKGILSDKFYYLPKEKRPFKKTIQVSPIKDNLKVLVKIWCKNIEDFELINTLPGFIDNCNVLKKNDLFTKNMGDFLPFKKYYFHNNNVNQVLNNSKIVSYYTINSCDYEPSEQLINQYQEKLNELIIKYNEITEIGNINLLEKFNIDYEMDILEQSFKKNYQEEYNNLISLHRTIHPLDNEIKDIKKPLIEKVEVSVIEFLTCPPQRNITIFYNDKTTEIKKLFESEIIIMYGHLMDQSTKQYFKLI